MIDVSEEQTKNYVTGRDERERLGVKKALIT
jgi:hypothetical protein